MSQLTCDNSLTWKPQTPLCWDCKFMLYTYIMFYLKMVRLIEPRCEKTGPQGFRPGPTKTGLSNHRRCLEAWNFGFRNKRYCTIRVAKTKTQISFTVTAKLICVFIFAFAKSWFSHNEAQLNQLQGSLKQFFRLFKCYLRLSALDET